ncbi:MAG: PSD1 and planctomycete cytochrome C domain-containing protein [Chthoniobacteraceae bacterium]
MLRLRFSSAVAACSLLAWSSSLRADELRFNREIRPILSNHCFACHGPDEKKREAKLRLDARENAVAEHEGVRTIVPGQPDESELMVRILTHDSDEVMPPPKSKKPAVTPAEAATLRRWIEQGAKYESHWAFMPLDRSASPVVQDEARVKNPIDRFILARLDREGIEPAPEADRATLVRRLSLDILGLLPSPDEVESFVNDTNTTAYEKLVDRLLASPHYGERWGRHWLDQARYADSNGYTIDNDRGMWPFRDWVIKALNDDLPFDQFTIEQLAGDLLPKATKSQLIATAFHRNTLINEEGGVDKEQFRNEAVVDRVNTTGAVWLGLTVGCAQCHTHKFDPITQREYYELFGFFNQGTDVNNKGETIAVVRGEVFGNPVALPPPPAVPDLAKQQAAWEKAELAKIVEGLAPSAPEREVKWTPAQYVEYDTASGASFELLPDGSLLADGRGAFNDTYRVVAKSGLKQIAAVRLRVLTHESLPKKGPGLAGNGNFVLTDFEAKIDGVELPFVRAFADREQPKFPASNAIDDDPKTGWAINVAKGESAVMNADHEAVFIFAKPLELAAQPIEFKLHHDLNEKYLIGRFAIDFSETAPGGAGKPESALIAALKIPPAKRSEAGKKLVLAAFEKANPPRAAAKKPAPNPDLAELMIMKETDKPRTTFIHLRGDFLRDDVKTGPLQPGGLSAVPPALPAGAGRTRLDLAKWLVSRDNPLTPRVTMNRVWMRYFGRGLVETDEDFGAQGSAPTHPELLDWLAHTFVEGGWSMKAMHRLIVTSATYRQSSSARPDLAEKDPRNLLLARQERVRVEAEIVRDAALSASGLLDRTIGGPSVHPPQAEGVYAFTQNTKKWNADSGADRFRRALYTQFYRAAPYPLFTTFDAPDFQTVCTRRVRSNTPLQALTLANDPAFVEIAAGLARQALLDVKAPEHGDDPQPALDRAFARALCRPPRETERRVLRAYFDRQAAAFRDDPASAMALLPADGNLKQWSPDLAAAIICVARTLFNTDGFITRE